MPKRSVEHRERSQPSGYGIVQRYSTALDRLLKPPEIIELSAGQAVIFYKGQGFKRLTSSQVKGNLGIFTDPNLEILAALFKEVNGNESLLITYGTEHTSVGLTAYSEQKSLELGGVNSVYFASWGTNRKQALAEIEQKRKDSIPLRRARSKLN